MKKGYTLLELLVASALFMIFITVASSLVVQMLRSYRQGESLVRPMQQARDAMAVLTYAFRGSIALVNTSPYALNSGTDKVCLALYQGDNTSVDSSYNMVAPQTPNLIPYGNIDNSRAYLMTFYRQNGNLMVDRYPQGPPNAGGPKFTYTLLSPVTRLTFKQNRSQTSGAPTDPVVTIELGTMLPDMMPTADASGRPAQEMVMTTLVFHRATEVQNVTIQGFNP